MTCDDYITAAFSRDFVAEGYDHDTVERIHHSVFDEWIRALAQSGLFTNHAVANAAHRWKDNPHSLLDALLADADEITVKRYEIAWHALDRTSHLGFGAPPAAEYA
ncbi:conserved hypothetical protein (plasmid) [Rhodococcus jostii RHA1]|uniref:Uncharacterized protein n=2 Tax=Rhodococcus jostii TaxID=132919 RepID=Q0RW93_RHOJR|nr:conserved hypothetical protein [Rhodococcus jostii RHA1]